MERPFVIKIRHGGIEFETETLWRKGIDCSERNKGLSFWSQKSLHRVKVGLSLNHDRPQQSEMSKPPSLVEMRNERDIFESTISLSPVRNC